MIRTVHRSTVSTVMRRIVRSVRGNRRRRHGTRMLLALALAASLVPGVALAQDSGTVMECAGSQNGAKFTYLSQEGERFNFQFDWDEGATFVSSTLDITNGTCETCPTMGGIGMNRPPQATWVILRTDASQPVVLKWGGNAGNIAFCGEDRSLTVGGAMVMEALVQATTLDNGEVVVLGELLDTNDDQIPSAGDTAKIYKFPNTFDGGDYDTSLGTLECAIVNANLYPDQRSLRVQFDNSCRINLIYWSNREAHHEPTQIHERFGFWYDNQTQKVDLVDSETFVQKDWVKVNNVSRSERPSSSSTDDPWLTVQFNY